MTVRITDDMMTLEVGERVVAARFSEPAAAGGHGPRVVSAHPVRLFTRNQAITALTVAGLDEYPDSHPLIVALHEELR
jgi:hypothetical protein